MAYESHSGAERSRRGQICLAKTTRMEKKGQTSNSILKPLLIEDLCLDLDTEY